MELNGIGWNWVEWLGNGGGVNRSADLVLSRGGHVGFFPDIGTG